MITLIVNNFKCQTVQIVATVPNYSPENHQRISRFRAISRAISLSSSGDGGRGPSGGYTTY